MQQALKRGRHVAIRRWRSLPIFWQIVIPNVVILVAAGSVLAFTPAAVSRAPSTGQTLVLAAAVLAMVVVNVIFIRGSIRPLERLARLMGAVDPLSPGNRIGDPGGSAETRQLAVVFDEMLERLESERRESGYRMLSAQESERQHLARELHDEIAQGITALMLAIDHAARQAPASVQPELREAQEVARALSSDLRGIARRLRPEALDDLGLRSALIVLGDAFTERARIDLSRSIQPNLPPISREAELVAYRVAQESLTNVARHSGARNAELRLHAVGDSVVLVVSDDGRGLNRASAGTGIRGMKERALLVSASVQVGARNGGGTEVRLTVPAEKP